MLRKINLAAAAFLFVFAAKIAVAQGINPPAVEQARAVKALSAEEIRDLLEGRGMGLAKAAELNRHPGPAHLLELASQLGLSDNDATAVRRAFEAMRTEARALGNEILAAERELDRLFAHGHADLAAVEALTAKIGVLQGRLRAVHLKAHLDVRPLLAAETIARYDALRGYVGEADHSPGADTHRH